MNNYINLRSFPFSANCSHIFLRVTTNRVIINLLTNDRPNLYLADGGDRTNERTVRMTLFYYIAQLKASDPRPHPIQLSLLNNATERGRRRTHNNNLYAAGRLVLDNYGFSSLRPSSSQEAASASSGSSART